jgi:hypothetical protein
VKKILIISALLALSACDPLSEGSTSVEGFEANLMVAAVVPGYGTSDVIFIGDTEDESDVVIEKQVHTTNPADIAIAVNGDNFYRLGRYEYDTLTSVKLNSETSVVSLGLEYSVLGDDSSANPAGMVFVSEDRAYISRTDSPMLWLVNPLAEVEDDFLIDEIDLSTFSAGADTKPHMADMEIVGNKLFVVLTRLDGFNAKDNSAVVVINTTTNTIIDADSDNTNGTQAIALLGRNASEITYLNNKLYVVASGDYGNSDTVEKYTGGLYSIDLANGYAVDEVVPDGVINDGGNNVTVGNLMDLDIAPNGDIYFVGSDRGYETPGDWTTYYQYDSVYVIEAGDDKIKAIDLGEGDFNIGDIQSNSSELYVGVHVQTAAPNASAGVKVVGHNTNALTGFIETTYNPVQIIVLN